MKRGLPTALVVAALLNLWAAEAGPLAQQPPAPADTATTATTTTSTAPAPPPQQPAPAPAPAKKSAPQGGRLVIHAASGGGARKHHAKKHHAKKASRVKAAGDPGVTIKDFSFGPSSVTVHAGDTVTWTNAGPSAHTATGNGFDTGTLKKGQSGSHTFTQAGTFSYVCTIHPFMKGTVVVAASAGSNSGSSSPGRGASSGSSGSSAGTPAAKSPASSGGLPNTGLDVGSLVFSGVLMLAAGLLLRRRAA